MERPKLMLMNDGEDTFRYYTLVKRVPGLIRGVISENSLEGEKADKLEKLAKDFEDDGRGVCGEVAGNGFDVIKEYWGKMWRETPWLHGECYMYHVVAQIMGWEQEQFDFFANNKDKSVVACLPAIHKACEKLAEGTSPCTETLIKGSLWGNKVDLCLFSDTDTSRLEATRAW
eukprot:TRINITY_DN17001_c0_g2_i2.p1 TRINITY_DN17001_c0_g2~~TRINITY_DN17001_c0_g2_i2.p1  ORF type:complete len:173 (+),score=79.88 TRINITY_DN17001_c0_g2_i2:44-562(+)